LECGGSVDEWRYHCSQSVSAGQAEIREALAAVEAKSAQTDERHVSFILCTTCHGGFLTDVLVRRFNAILNAVNDLGGDMRLVKGLLASSRLGSSLRALCVGLCVHTL
jgi:hypothetical protein